MYLRLVILKSKFCVNSVSKSWSVFLQSSMIHQTCTLVAHIFVLCACGMTHGEEDGM